MGTLALLFFAPMTIIVAYSFLTRGVYGGVTGEWNHRELYPPLRPAVRRHSSSYACSVGDRDFALPRSRLSAGAVHCALGKSEEPVSAACDAAVLDKLPGAHLRLDVPAARHRTDQHCTARNSASSSEPLPLLYNNGAVLLGLVYGYLPFVVLPFYATLERIDNSLLEAAADLGARPGRRSRESSFRSARRHSGPEPCSCSFPASAPI